MGRTGQRRPLDRQIEDGEELALELARLLGRGREFAQQHRREFGIGQQALQLLEEAGRRLGQSAGVEQQRMIAVAGIAPRRQRAAQLAQPRGLDQRRAALGQDRPHGMGEGSHRGRAG